jgi:hypothetical protein
VDRDISLLGNTENIKRVFIAGAEQDLTPLPPRRPIPGWRLASMGSTLTREVALRGPRDEPVMVEELH